MTSISPLEQLALARFEAPAILKKLATASRRLAELKRIVGSIPNQGILINTLGLQEAKDSSEIENITTTHDELFKDDVLLDAFANSSWSQQSQATQKPEEAQAPLITSQAYMPEAKRVVLLHHH